MHIEYVTFAKEVPTHGYTILADKSKPIYYKNTSITLSSAQMFST